MQVTEPNRFVECVIAPSYSAAAFQILTTRPSWKKNVRLLRPVRSRRRGRAGRRRRSTADCSCSPATPSGDDFAIAKVVTKRPPTDAEMADLRFAWMVCKHVKSNAIVLAADGRVVGVGAGPDEPGRFGADRRPQGGRPLRGLGAGIRRVLPVPRQRRRRGQGGSDGDRATGRVDARRRFDRRLRRARAGDGIYGGSALPALRREPCDTWRLATFTAVSRR